jgi:hypothetical protein
MAQGWLALTIALLAGISQAVGDSVILFFNRVRPARFALGLTLSGLLFVLGLLVRALSLWLGVALLFGVNEQLGRVILIVFVGCVPLLLGFLSMAATFGLYVGWFLRFLGWLIVMAGVHFGLGFTTWQAFLCTTLARLLVELLSVAFRQPLDWISAWVWRVTTGANIGMSVRGQRALRTGLLQRSTILGLSNSLSAQLFGDGTPAASAGADGQGERRLPRRHS